MLEQRTTKAIEATVLRARLAREIPENFDPRRGLAVVCTSDGRHYVAGHIPGSINIPAGFEEIFEERYDRTKEIVVYCEHETAATAALVARRLSDAGFLRVAVLAGGLPEWCRASGALEVGNQWPMLINATERLRRRFNDQLHARPNSPLQRGVLTPPRRL